uniref:Putative transposase, mutator type, MULE transposase domain protein n=1 Tax=Tanacetum cinerariifolium TaxID=118510 RepID=A0A699HE25_TANCI|nr:putative transposase, mutator type, MULE transposase domain protein [Tanacetum cinerariifolium]
MYVSGRVDIFDMVDIDLFTVVALNMMVLKLGYTGESEHLFYNYLRPLTTLDVGLYALACEGDVRCLATLVGSFKLTEVYIEHGVTVLDSYLRAPQFKATLEDITNEPAGSIAANITEKMLLLTWHESSETTKEPDCILTPPTDESVITYTQLSGAHGVDTQSHFRVKSFGVDDLDLNLNEPVNLNVSQVETQSELPVSEEPDVGPTQEPILAEVSTQDPIVAEVITQEAIMAEVGTEAPIVEEVGTQEFSVEDVVIEDYVSSEEDGEDAEHGNGQQVESAPTDGQFFYDDEGIDTAYETEYDVQSSEDTSTDDDDDDDVDEDFLVDEENEIVEPDVDVHLFGISMDLPFDNIGITNLVPDDVLEGKDVDVINADGFDSDPGNDEERNYRKRRLAELRTKMEGVINASGQWKYLFYTGQKFTSPKEAKDIVYLHFIKSRRNSKLYKNDSVRIRARCEGKVPVFTVSQGTGPTGPYSGMEAGLSGSSGPTTRSKKRKNTNYVVELQSTNPNTTVKIAVERNIDPSLPTMVFQRIYVCLGALKFGFRACRRDLLGLDGAFMKGPFPGQVLVVVRLDLNNGIYPLAYALVEAETKSRAKSDLFLNNIYEVFNGVIDKCTGPLTPTATRIMKSIKKEAYLMKVQWNEENKYQVSGSLGDQCAVDVVGRPKKKRKRSKHDDEPFVKYGKLSRKGRTITCQSCGNIGHNKATYKGQGGNNAEGSGSASRQAQKTKPAVGQDGLGGLGAGVVIGLSAAAGEGGAGDPGGVGVASQAINDNGKFLMVDEEEVTSNKLASMVEEMIMLIKGLGGGDLRDYVSVIGGTDDSDKGTDVMKDTVSQKNLCEEKVPLNNNIGKQIDDFVDMPGEVVEKRMDTNVPDEIDGAKGEQIPNHAVKKGNIEFLVCKEVANLGVNELVDKQKPLKRKKIYAE